MSKFLRYYNEVLDRWAEAEIAKGAPYQEKMLDCDPVSVSRIALTLENEEAPEGVTIASKGGESLAVTEENISDIKDAVVAKANAVYAVRDAAKAAIAAAATKTEVESIVMGIAGTL